jgi:hypothetical protein
MLREDQFTDFKELQEGEFTIVYKAISKKTKKEYAIKRCMYDTEANIDRVKKEIYGTVPIDELQKAIDGRKAEAK